MRPSDTRFGLRSVLALVALALAAVPFGLLLFFVQDQWPPLQTVDDDARDGLHRFALAHDVFATAMKVLSFVGSAPVYFVVFTVLAGWLLRRELHRLAAFVVVTQLGGAALNEVVKAVVHRARPIVADPLAHASGLSFPSGHSQAAVVSYSVLSLLFWPAMSRGWRWVALVLSVVMVLGIGLSRVALSVHYVSDVLAGYTLGAAWVTAMTAVFSAWRRERGERPVDPGDGLAPEQASQLRPGSGV
ncbi:undecaprenyl-diphosphatase [Umezawaea tangerina]|uniref:Undecaprenyl-diphosphatase n=2 Tax=Umezawaea tangerina TaxID=84725 RepID=A0A2T0SZ56_9PSEU|nr:undecaprenyl-diphosphatase [Umezawaea tangerina]